MIITIDTSDQKIVRVGLKEDGQIVDKLEEQNEYGSQVVLPMIKRILLKNNLELRSLTGVEVNIGPGSFTGLRVGASIAQTLAFTLKIPVNGEFNKAIELQYT